MQKFDLIEEIYLIVKKRISAWQTENLTSSRLFKTLFNFLKTFFNFFSFFNCFFSHFKKNPNFFNFFHLKNYCPVILNNILANTIQYKNHFLTTTGPFNLDPAMHNFSVILEGLCNHTEQYCVCD